MTTTPTTPTTGGDSTQNTPKRQKVRSTPTTNSGTKRVNAMFRTPDRKQLKTLTASMGSSEHPSIFTQKSSHVSYVTPNQSQAQPRNPASKPTPMKSLPSSRESTPPASGDNSSSEEDSGFQEESVSPPLSLSRFTGRPALRSASGETSSSEEGSIPDCEKRAAGLPILGSLGEDFEVKEGDCYDMIAHSLNQSLGCSDCFEKDHIRRMIRSKDQVSDRKRKDALKDLGELFSARILILELRHIDADHPHNSPVIQLHRLGKDGTLLGFRQPKTWKELLDVDLNTVLLSMDSAVLRTLSDDHVDAWDDTVQFVKRCQVELRYALLQQLLGRLGFFEPAALIHMDTFPTEFPADQWKMGAKLVLLCTNKRYDKVEVKEVARVYRRICYQGGYIVKHSTETSVYSNHCKTSSHQSDVVRSTLAEVAHLMWRMDPNAKLTHGSSGVASLQTAQESVLVSDLLEPIKTQAVIELCDATSRFRVRNRDGDLIAEHKKRDTLQHYIAAVYGREWLVTIPRLLPDATKSLMKSSILFTEHEGLVSCTVTSKRIKCGSLPLSGLDYDDLLEKLYRKYDVDWFLVVHLVPSAIETKGQQVEIIPPNEKQVMRRRLKITIGHPKNPLLHCAKLLSGGYSCTGRDEDDLLQKVWTRHKGKWEEECIQNKLPVQDHL